MKTDKIIITLPSGKEVEILSEKEYFEKHTSGSRVSLPMPGDFNNWASYLLKDYTHYKDLSLEDKIFIMRQQYEQYSMWPGLKWEELEGDRCRTFQLGEEPEVIHVIKTGFKDKYIIVNEDAYEISLGKTEIMTKEEVEIKYKIELDKKK